MNEEKHRLVHEDIYLVKQEPARGKKIVERSKKANLHVLAEFTLQVGLITFVYSLLCGDYCLIRSNYLHSYYLLKIND